MQFRTLLCLATALLGLQPLVAQAGPCDAYFTFDGNLADASGNGYDGIATGPAATSEKTAARLPYIMSFEQGRSGQALKLDGTTAVRVPLDLNIEGCPQITITAWVKFDDNPTKGSQYILSSGPGGPGLVRDGTNLSVYGGEKRYRQSKALRGGSWEFIAASLDYEAGKMTVHWRNRVSEVDIKAKGTKQADVWIGAYDDDARMAVQSGLIDDLRVTAGILTAEQISQLRNNVGQAAAAQRLGDQMNPNLGLWEPDSQNNPTQISGDQAVVINHEEQYAAPDLGDGTDEVGALPKLFGDPDLPPDIGDGQAADSGQRVMMGQTDSLPGSGDLGESSESPTSVMPGGSRGTDLSSNESLQQARDENAPLDITYDSEEEGEAAAARAEEQRKLTAPQYSRVLGETSHYRDELDLVTEYVDIFNIPNTYEGCWLTLNGKRLDFCSGGRPGSGAYLDLPTANIDALGACVASESVDGSPSFTKLYIRGKTTTWEGRPWVQEDYEDGLSTPDCAGWTVVACPTGTAATGFVAHTTENRLAGARGRVWRGIQIICRAQVWKELESGQ